MTSCDPRRAFPGSIPRTEPSIARLSSARTSFWRSSTGYSTGSGCSSPTTPKSPTGATMSSGPWGESPSSWCARSDGEVRVLLNSCRHRGTKLCRGEAGNARHFVCPYHGWSYEIDGALITTSYDEHLPPGMDKADWGLVPALRVETYKGLVFAAWDPGVPALGDYLGDIAWYLDALFWRTPEGMEVLAPPHRWRTRANWKIGALNFIGDSQHVRTTHAGPVTLDRVRSEKEGFYVRGGGTVSRSSPTRAMAAPSPISRPACRRKTISPTPRRCATPTRRCWARTSSRCCIALRVIVATSSPISRSSNPRSRSARRRSSSASGNP